MITITSYVLCCIEKLEVTAAQGIFKSILDDRVSTATNQKLMEIEGSI